MDESESRSARRERQRRAVALITAVLDNDDGEAELLNLALFDEIVGSPEEGDLPVDVDSLVQLVDGLIEVGMWLAVKLESKTGEPAHDHLRDIARKIATP